MKNNQDYYLNIQPIDQCVLVEICFFRPINNDVKRLMRDFGFREEQHGYKRLFKDTLENVEYEIERLKNLLDFV